MSQIRKKSIKSTAWIYVGFLIGAINTYFLTHKQWFSTDQNGLTRALIDLSQLAFAFSSFGVTSYLIKFSPYYQDNLSEKKNDLLGIALIVSIFGFALTSAGLFIMKPLVILKFSAKSILLVEYFYWIIPMSFFILQYNILEAYAYTFGKGVLTNMLRETVVRFYTFCIITLKILGFIEFNTFMILFSFQYSVVVGILAFHLYKNNQLWINFKPSKVTRKFRKKIISIMLLTFLAVIIGVLRQSIDGIVLAAKQNLAKVGIFGLASYMVSVLMAPFRSLVSITVPLLSRAWKDKNIKEVERIYKRSSINMLGFSLFLFFCIWLNFDNAINFFNINPDYLEGKWVFFLLGMVTIIELGTGVNSQIIGTSTYYRFELWTSLLLTTMIIPLSYILTVKYGILGPAISNLISFTVYNLIRYLFLLNKFSMQPFSMKTVELIFIALGAYALAYFITKDMIGIRAIILSLLIFCPIYAWLFYIRNISPDVKQIIESLKNRFARK